MSYPVTYIDACGRTVTLKQPPQRIISLVPSQTELLAYLGLDDEVVGLTRFCVHPSDWKVHKSIVGGTKQVNLERIAALAPDFFLANLEENTLEMVEVLESIAPVYVTSIGDVPEALTMIRDVGALTGRSERADALVADIKDAFRMLSAWRPRRAVYLIWQQPFMTVGVDTFIHDVMTRAGFVNVFGERERYPEVTMDEIVAARPEVVLLPDEPFPFKTQHAEEMQAWLPDAHVHLVDGALFSWYGSRLVQTPAYLERLRTAIDAVSK